MKLIKKLNPIQITGLIISVLGLFFIGFPTVIGITAIKIITFLFIVLSFYSLIFSAFVKSRISTIISMIIVGVSLYAFINPEYVLILIGISCLFSGLNGVVLTLSKFKESTERNLITSIIFILLGVFAIINSEAALSTIVLIMGIMVVILGIVIFAVGATITRPFFSFTMMSHAHTSPSHFNSSQQGKSARVFINIDDDEIEEIDFKDVE